MTNKNAWDLVHLSHSANDSNYFLWVSILSCAKAKLCTCMHEKLLVMHVYMTWGTVVNRLNLKIDVSFYVLTLTFDLTIKVLWDMVSPITNLCLYAKRLSCKTNRQTEPILLTQSLGLGKKINVWNDLWISYAFWFNYDLLDNTAP